MGENANNSKPKLVCGFGEINFGTQYRQGNRVYDSNEVAMCVAASPVGGVGGHSYLYLIRTTSGGNINEQDYSNWKLEKGQ